MHTCKNVKSHFSITSVVNFKSHKSSYLYQCTKYSQADECNEKIFPVKYNFIDEKRKHNIKDKCHGLSYTGFY